MSTKKQYSMIENAHQAEKLVPFACQEVLDDVKSDDELMYAVMN
jgi:hypothetical protein